MTTDDPIAALEAATELEFLALRQRIERLEAMVGPPDADLETGEIIDNDMLPEWFSLGWGLKGWKVKFSVADKWREDHEYSEDYCLDIIYRVRGWWNKDHEKKGRDPYRTFQTACRDNWGGGKQPIDNPDEYAQKVLALQDRSTAAREALDRAKRIKDFEQAQEMQEIRESYRQANEEKGNDDPGKTSA